MDLLKRAAEHTGREPRFGYIAPTYTQAKDVAWSYLKEYTAAIPGAKVSESELSVTLPHNGARIRLYGADNYDRLRGLYLDGVVIDEAGDQHPRAWTEVIRPALSDRKGWATFIGTPKGRNEFFRIFERSRTDPDWYSARLAASETGLIDESELRDARSQMSAEQYAQEYECDFESSIIGAYYAAGLREADKQGRIGPLAIDPMMELRAYWDIGGTGARSDATAIWVAQFVGQQVRVLDYYEAAGQPLATHVNWLRDNGYGRAVCVLPHDGANAEKVIATTYQSSLNQAGFSTIVVKNQGRGAAVSRIEAGRRVIGNIWFDRDKTAPGREALAHYHERMDEVRRVGLGPEHDWSSHACLAAGSMIETARGLIPIEAVEIGEKVWTPAGWGHVSNAGAVKVAQKLLRLTFDDGSTLTVTPDHKVFTTDGVVRADALGYDSLVHTRKSAPCMKSDRVSNVGYRAAFSESFAATVTGGGQSAAITSARRAAGSGSFIGRLSAAVGGLFRSMVTGTISTLATGLKPRATMAEAMASTSGRTSTASATIARRKAATSLAGRRASATCTATCGNITTAQSRPGTTSTTSTATRATTGLKTLRSSVLAIIRAFTRQTTLGSAAMATNGSWQQPRDLRPNGTAPRKGERGTLHMAKLHGRSGSGIARLARAAGLNTKRLGRVGQSSVRRVVSSERITEAQKVYDLTVDKHHCYVANGVLVSNCDAFGMMCMAYLNNQTQTDWSKPLVRGLKGIA